MEIKRDLKNPTPIRSSMWFGQNQRIVPDHVKHCFASCILISFQITREVRLKQSLEVSVHGQKPHGMTLQAPQQLGLLSLCSNIPGVYEQFYELM